MGCVWGALAIAGLVALTGQRSAAAPATGFGGRRTPPPAAPAAAAGQVDLTGWCREWLGRIATVYLLNKARLASHDPGLERQTPAFDTAHDALSEALGGMFAAAEHQLARLSPEAREGKPLRSLLNHREGLSVFLDRPRVPLDNNLAERLLRGPAIGRPVTLAAVVDGRRTQARNDGVRMTERIECRYHGRDFTAGEMALLRKVDRRTARAQPPSPVEGVLPAHRLVQARRRTQGHDGACHHARHAQGRPHRPAAPEVEAEPARTHRLRTGHQTAPLPPPTTLDEIRPLELRTVAAGTRQGRLWNEFVARHHYLGYKTLVGAQMRYAVHDRNGWPLAMLGFSTAA